MVNILGTQREKELLTRLFIFDLLFIIVISLSAAGVQESV
jgi:hypothetical protein